MLFRFSERLGLLDSDDLAGAPYYLQVVDKHTVAQPQPVAEPKKEDKNDIRLCVNQPGKIALTLMGEDQKVDTFEILAPQFGTIESLSGELFGKEAIIKDHSRRPHRKRAHHREHRALAAFTLQQTTYYRPARPSSCRAAALALWFGGGMVGWIGGGMDCWTTCPAIPDCLPGYPGQRVRLSRTTCPGPPDKSVRSVIWYNRM